MSKDEKTIYWVVGGALAVLAVIMLIAYPYIRGGAVAERSAVTTVLMAEVLAQGDMGIAVACLAPAGVSTALSLWGDADQQATYLPEFVGENVPAAALALLEGLEDVSGLQWDLDELKEAGEARQVEIATQIADSDDVRDVVTGLEQQYDAFHSKAANLLADDEPLPSGEEIGAQFEQFLARLEEPEE